MTDNPLHDPEREHLARTGEVLRRVDRCANRKRRGAAADCPNDALPGQPYCSVDCLCEGRARSFVKNIGGSIAREVERPKWERDPIGGTRFPQENSRRGDGYA